MGSEMQDFLLSFNIPKEVKYTEKGDKVTIVLEPFEKGYGDTLGAALHRILLSSFVLKNNSMLSKNKPEG